MEMYGIVFKFHVCIKMDRVSLTYREHYRVKIGLQIIV